MNPKQPQLSTFLEALAFAANKHRSQRRKDAEASPYVNHPIALARVLAVEGGVEDWTVLCAAVLHDTIEDTQTTQDELLALFGAEVTAVVLEVTEADPVVKNQTATSSYKPALLSNGVKTMVPPFISTGEKIVVRTEDASYVERAKG